MKLVSLAALAALVAPAQSVQFLGRGSKAASPVERVVALIKDLKTHIIADGKAEQASYDKYACWCEDTLGRKAKGISTAKEEIEELGVLIVKLKAEIASHGAEIAQTQKDLAANVEARREATEIRDKEHRSYVDEKTEAEQCSGALEAAVKVLAGAGAKRGFLETMQEAQLLSVVAGVKTVYLRPAVSRVISNKDLDVLKRFVERPEDFVSRGSGMSAAQLSNNPFGDYAPKSTQIQGILKGMYDTFLGDLEKANAEEAEAQKSHEELMRTKEQEAETLQATLEQHSADQASKTKKLADSEGILDTTKEQLEADEVFFTDTKEGCKVKASEWSERTRLRTEELAGINKCVEILSSEDAKAIFKNSSTTLVQLSASRHSRRGPAHRAAAASKLTQMAVKFGSQSAAQAAHMLRAGGHFDKVMAAIDAMVEVLRREEQDDIAHRDRCQNSDNKNKNDIEDLNSHIDKAGKTIKRLESDAKQLESEISTLKEDINTTRTQRAERLEMRNEEVEEFRQALKDDADAVALLQDATKVMKEFYKRNKVEMALASTGKRQEPEYTEDQDKAPETTWSDGKYGGRKSETTGLVAILEMITEDVQKEMEAARKDDAEAQAQYEKEDAAMKDTLDEQLALKLKKEKELNEVNGKAQDKQEFKEAKESDLGAEEKLKESLTTDCKWVETHFESRRTKRKAEMDGLAQAKSYLAGVEDGDEI